MQIKMRRVGERRTLPFFQLRPEYEIVIADGGQAKYHDKTVSPSVVLVRKGKVHTSDSYDWIRAADMAFSPHGDSWTNGVWPQR